MSQPEFEYLGPYRIERTLGRGGMGTVYKGVHAKSGEAVAIKVLATGIASQMRFRRRFAAEVETLKRLKHPNIVQPLGYGEEQGMLFYSMEYVDGHSLHEHLRQHKRLPWEDVVQVGVETAAALKHAHDLGVIHRDLKPANLMLDSHGRVKLTDFGIAKLFGSSDMTAAGAVIGTADYMPPEQAEGKTVTTRSDLYSLGSVLYALLSGKPPFGGKSVPEVLYSVRYNTVPSLQEKVPEIPQELAELVHQLLEKDPSRRPPTALVVGNRLKSLQQGTRMLQDLEETEKPSPAKEEQIGAHLTSLDLSDVDDEELKLTGRDSSGIELDSDLSAHEGIGTHEQQTLVAPHRMLDKEEPRTQRPEESPGQSEEDSEGLVRLPSEEGPLTSGGPSHFTPIDDNARKDSSFTEPAPEEESRFDWLHYGSIAGIVLVLVGSVAWGWYMLQPESADALYERIVAAAESGDDSALLQAQGDIDDFIRRFPDDERTAELASWAQQSELLRWTRILQRRASRPNTAAEMTAIEHGFLDAMLGFSRDPAAGRQKLSALLTVFGDIENLPRDERKLLDLATHALESGASVDTDAPTAAATQLERVIQAAETSLPSDRLPTYYRDLLLLYGDEPWAAEQMDRIRARLGSDS